MFSHRTAWKLAPNRLAMAQDAHRRAGHTLLDLTTSNPTTCGLEYSGKELLEDFTDAQALEYHPDPKGLRSARAAVAAYYADLNAPVSPKDLILTTSTSEAYSFAFRLLCDFQDEVLVPKPSYPLFEYLAGLQDVRPVPYSLVYDHGWQIDFHSLNQALSSRSRAIIVVHPNNPTGSYVKAGEAAELNALCEERGLALVADEVFLDYAHPGHSQQAQTFAVNDSTLTFTLSGVSKISGLPQIKLAWMVVSGPDELAREALSRLEMIADTFLSMNTPVQLAASTLLDERRRIQPQLKARIAANLAELDGMLAMHPSCTRPVIEGGWYAMLRVPVTRSDEDLALALLSQCDVLIHPGYFYDFEGDGCLVLSLITPEAEFGEGVDRLLQFLAR